MSPSVESAPAAPNYSEAWTGPEGGEETSPAASMNGATRLADEPALLPALAAVVETFRVWLYLPDAGPLLAVLGAVAANLLAGDPVWLLVVSPPGGGKSELLGTIRSLPNIHPTATLTEAALLSGTPKKEHEGDAKGGLLRTIGGFGIIVCKDFGSILNMNRDARAATLAALREVYDGEWTRHVGTGGGRTLHWHGKVGLVAACTPTIDRHHAVMAAMGERLILFRLPDVDAGEQARRALAHAGHEVAMRQELAERVGSLFADGLPRQPRPPDAGEQARLVDLAMLVVRARSAVERDGYTREVELIPGSEAPTRLVVTLERLLAGLDAIGCSRATAWRVIVKAGLDCIPAIRLAALAALGTATEPLETPKIADTLDYPTVTTRRALEDLTAHGLATRTSRGSGKTADKWALTDWASGRLAACAPEMSIGEHPLTLPLHAYDDISETQAPSGDPASHTKPPQGSRRRADLLDDAATADAARATEAT